MLSFQARGTDGKSPPPPASPRVTGIASDSGSKAWLCLVDGDGEIPTCLSGEETSLPQEDLGLETGGIVNVPSASEATLPMQASVQEDPHLALLCDPALTAVVLIDATDGQELYGILS
ncbi:hypothetical protein GUJ93_ZPchr0010g9591 [Zizania palustris]|uniref:Uncharacterized protein n=1 Tax=Zizania palustris TaxID=103762 RepID=A0A8J5W7K8_ZIZPA|nr:hypothetical protein GUJ93_ZPchr0010g9591 [Zizania palustris]